MSSLLKAVYYKLFPGIPIILERELSGCETLLDLGCGRNSFLLLPHVLASMKLSVGVEVFEPYLLESKRNQRHSQYIQADVRSLEFKPKSFDAVVAIELIEHVTKEEGTELLNKIEKWASKKILILTPNEYIWQDGYDNNPAQEHKSGWGVDELRRHGFTVLGVSGWRGLRGYKGAIKYKPTFFWTGVSELTQKVTYYYPSLAFELIAMKEIKETNEK
jgi:hypothetical protein